MTVSRTHPAADHRPTHTSSAPGRPQPQPPARGPLGSWLLNGTPADSPWRVLAALGAIGEAVAHIPVMQEHLTEAPYIGVGFVLLTAAGFLLAQLLLTADTTAVWVSTVVVAGLALAGYVLSRAVGLPQIGDDVGNWTEPLAIVAIAAEALMLATAATHLLSRHTSSSKITKALATAGGR
jgi:hypothetical protein